MARAKRTDRAEARRRYRASLGYEAAELDDDGSIESDAEPARPVERPSRARSEVVAASTAPAPRPSVMAALRSSFVPLDLRADLRAVPRLILHRSVWLPTLLTIGSAVAYGALATPAPAGGAQGQISTPELIAGLAFQYFVVPPPVASIFLAGFMAPRASYLTGGIVGLVGGIAFAVMLLNRMGPAAQLADAEINGIVRSALITSPAMGIFFGGAAGWYKRFLTLANPNRARRSPPGKGPDRSGRRGSESRPILARRR